MCYEETRELSDHQLLEELLGGLRHRRRALAREVLALAGHPAALRRLGQVELRQMGLSTQEAARLVSAFELGRRSLFDPPFAGALDNPTAAYHYVAQDLLGMERECFVVVVLDIRNRPLLKARIAESSVDACPVDPREVFLPAVRQRGSGILVAHNHPSGDPSPSEEDLALTRRLLRAGELLGIILLDHIIVGAGASFVSLADRHLLGARVAP